MSLVATQPLLILEVDVGAPVEPGAIGAGRRRFIPIVGGRVSGSVTGEIIPGGGDWQTVHDDGNLQIEAHYAFRTHSGAVVEVLSSGVRAASAAVLHRLQAGELVDPCEYYFRTAIRFRTGAAELAHLNFRLAVARGERRKASVRVEVFEVL
jgi:Protein of unknown function (DUF3237)